MHAWKFSMYRSGRPKKAGVRAVAIPTTQGSGIALPIEHESGGERGMWWQGESIEGRGREYGRLGSPCLQGRSVVCTAPL